MIRLSNVLHRIGLTMSSLQVSVVCPVHNNYKDFLGLLSSLKKQTVKSSEFEVIFVDNNTSPQLPAELIPENWSLVFLPSPLSSYAARNAGIAAAKGEIIAFIDVDCTPAPDWLEKGLEAIDTASGTIVAGAVEMLPGNEKSVWHFFDAVYNINNYRSVQRGFAKTANLFVPRKAFKTVGEFDAQRISGGDVEWTQRANTRGFQLKYASDARVSHPTRGALQQLKKQLRVGSGRSFPLWKSQQGRTPLKKNLCYLYDECRRQGCSPIFSLAVLSAYFTQLGVSFFGGALTKFGIRINR